MALLNKQWQSLCGIVPKVISVAILVLMSASIGGCFDGNSKLESAVYRQYNGTIPCDCEHCQKEFVNKIENSRNLFDAPSASRAPTFYIHPFDDPSFTRKVQHEIKCVSSRKGIVDDVWRVTIEYECDKCWPPTERMHKKSEEYSYVKGHLRFIRPL